MVAVFAALQHGRAIGLIVFFVLAAVGDLAKISSIRTFGVLIISIFDPRIMRNGKVLFCFVAPFGLSLHCGVYFFSVPTLFRR